MVAFFNLILIFLNCNQLQSITQLFRQSITQTCTNNILVENLAPGNPQSHHQLDKVLSDTVGISSGYGPNPSQYENCCCFFSGSQTCPHRQTIREMEEFGRDVPAAHCQATVLSWLSQRNTLNRQKRGCQIEDGRATLPSRPAETLPR